MLAGTTWTEALAEDADPRVAKVLAMAPGIDMHNHVYPAGTDVRPQAGAAQGPEMFVADELKKAGLTAVCAAYATDFAPNHKPGDAIGNYLHWLDAIDAQLERGHIRRALTLADLQAAHDSGQPTIVQSVEGAMFIEGSPKRVEEVYKRGLRHLQFLHERDDIVAPLGDVYTAPAHLGGLTPFGAEVVRECNRLGIVVDMAHASHDTLVGTLHASRQPFVVSHTNLASWTGKDPKMAQNMKPRLISKEDAKLVADAGGVVGVWTKLAGSVEEYVGSIKAMADAVGVDHTGIGTDTDLLSGRAGAGTNLAYPAMPGGFFPAVVGEMLRQGFTPEEASKIGGGNFCRIFGEVTGGRA